MTPLIGKKTFQRAEIIQLLSANIVASYLKFSAMQMLNNSILREIGTTKWVHVKFNHKEVMNQFKFMIQLFYWIL